MEQISNRADRLNIVAEDLFLYSATDLEVSFSTNDLSVHGIFIFVSCLLSESHLVLV